MKSKEDQLKNWQRIQNESQKRYSEKHRNIGRKSKPEQIKRNEKTPNGKRHRRTEETDRAIRAAKERDKWTCLNCGRKHSDGWKLNGCHLTPRKIGNKRSDKTDINQIWTGCDKCHKEYDSQNTREKKLIWLLLRPQFKQFAITLFWINNQNISSIDEIDYNEIKNIYFKIK